MKNLNDAIENVKTSIKDKFVAESFDYCKLVPLINEKELIIEKADLQEGFAFAWINASSEESKLGLAGFWFENISNQISKVSEATDELLETQDKITATSHAKILAMLAKENLTAAQDVVNNLSNDASQAQIDAAQNALANAESKKSKADRHELQRQEDWRNFVRNYKKNIYQ